MFFPSLLGGGGVMGGWEKFPSFTVFLFWRLPLAAKHVGFVCWFPSIPWFYVNRVIVLMIYRQTNLYRQEQCFCLGLLEPQRCSGIDINSMANLCPIPSHHANQTSWVGLGRCPTQFPPELGEDEGKYLSPPSLWPDAWLLVWGLP